MNEPRLGISEDESDLEDNRHQTAEPLSTPHRVGETPHSSHTDGRPPHPRYTHLGLLIRKASTLDTSRTPHPPGPRPAQTADLALTPRTSTHPAHSSTHLAHRTQLPRPASTLQTPALSLHPPHTPGTTRRPPHPCHTPRTRHRLHSSPRAHRTLRVRRARSQRSRSFGRRSRPCPPRRAAPAGKGGSAELLRPEIRRGGAPAASRGRGRELLATLHGPRSPAPPARSLSPAPRVAGDPRTPASGHAAGLARRSPLPFSPLTARRHLPQRCSRSETHSSAPAADTDSAEAAAGALRS